MPNKGEEHGEGGAVGAGDDDVGVGGTPRDGAFDAFEFCKEGGNFLAVIGAKGVLAVAFEIRRLSAGKDAQCGFFEEALFRYGVGGDKGAGRFKREEGGGFGGLGVREGEAFAVANGGGTVESVREVVAVTFFPGSGKSSVAIHLLFRWGEGDGDQGDRVLHGLGLTRGRACVDMGEVCVKTGGERCGCLN